MAEDRQLTMARLPRHLAGPAVLLLIAGPLLPATATAEAQPVPVQVAQVRQADVPYTLQGIGTVQAFNTVTLHAQVDGVLQQIRFTEGQVVHTGDVLAQIDPRPFQAALDQAIARKAQDEAQLVNARLNLQRFEGIGDFASRQQVATQQAMVDQLQAQVRGDEAAIENARTQLSYTTITAPMDGITGIRLVDQGNLLHATDTTGIVVLTQVRPISVIFTLPAENFGEIRRGMAAGPLPVTVLERARAQPLGEGQLALVDNQIDQTTGTLRLKATLPNADGALWPGQFVNVRLLLRTDRGVPTIPSTAVQRGPEGYWTYLVRKDRTVVPQPITVQRFDNGVAVLQGGPPVGTEVVSTGQYRLTPGATVQVVQAPPVATTTATTGTQP